MTPRKIFRDPRPTSPPEVGDPDVCTNGNCVTMRIHRPGAACDLRGQRRPGAGRRKVQP